MRGSFDPEFVVGEVSTNDKVLGIAGNSAACEQAVSEESSATSMNLCGSPVDFRLVEFDSVSSTNDLIKRAIDSGEDEGLVVRADSQDGGYGRYGRAWSSPKGGLYMSVLLDPASHIEDARELAAKLPTLSLLVSLSVRNAIVDEIGSGFSDKVKIKWPNDILFVDDKKRCDATSDDLDTISRPMFRKICGISLELHGGAVCIGIGINVDRSEEGDDGKDAQSEDAPRRNSPAFLSELVKNARPSDAAKVPNVTNSEDSAENVLITRLCNRVISHLAVDFSKWAIEPFACFKERYNSKLALNGLNVRIEDSKATVRTEGEVLGIDDRGCLLVRASDGSVECVSSGEAHVSLVK